LELTGIPFCAFDEALRARQIWILEDRMGGLGETCPTEVEMLPLARSMGASRKGSMEGLNPASI
jgi:hypothetical protein